MRLWSLLALLSLVGTFVVAGCAPKAKPAPAEPVAQAADMETLRTIRASFQHTDPSARVGLVTQTISNDRLAAVGEIDVREFREGDAITFIDSLQRPIANGRVIFVTETELHVKYEVAGGREPQQGDLAVRLNLNP